MSMNNEGLSPREHDEMRAVVVAGTQKLRRSSYHGGQLVAAGVALVLIGGVTGSAVSIYVSQSTTETAPPAATPSVPPDATAPHQCLDYEGSTFEHVPDGAGVAEAVRGADLPGGYVLSPGVTVTESADGASGLEAVARVCGETVSRAELIEIGNSIAAAIYAKSDSAELSTLVVEPWVPISSDAIAKDPRNASIRTSYQDYDWASPATLPEDAWQ